MWSMATLTEARHALDPRHPQWHKVARPSASHQLPPRRSHSGSPSEIQISEEADRERASGLWGVATSPVRRSGESGEPATG